MGRSVSKKHPGVTKGHTHPVPASKRQVEAEQRRKNLEYLNNRTISVMADAAPADVSFLNKIQMFWERGVVFKHLYRRGSTVTVETEDGKKIVFPSMSDLISFSKARNVFADCADVFLESPPRNKVIRTWDPIAGLIIRIAARDSVRVEHHLPAESRQMLQLMWRYCGQPVANTADEFVRFMLQISETVVRDGAKPAPPCVFVAEECAWVHFPTFRNWLSLPALTNYRQPLENLRQGLLLLDFRYVQVHRAADGEDVNLGFWRGPIESLMDGSGEA